MRNLTLNHLLLLFGSLIVPTFASAQVELSVTEPYERSQVAASEQGVIRKIMVLEGQRVKTGEVIAELDMSVLLQTRKLAELKANSQANVDSTKATLKLRESQKQNFDQLIRDGHANPFEVDQVVAQYEQAIADHKLALEELEQNKVELARIDQQLSQRTIRSPFDGVVIDIKKRRGEFASATDPYFATVVQLDRLRVKFHLFAAEANQLKAGQLVTVYLGSRQQPVPALISYVSPVVDPKTGLARVDVLINNRQLELQSGIACRWSKQESKLSSSSNRSVSHRRESAK